jgi:hypothetical protein
MSAPELEELHMSAMTLRTMARRQELMLDLDLAFNDLPAHHAAFVRSAIGLAKAAAAALDATVKCGLELRADLGFPEPPPRQRLRVIDGEPPAA